MRFEDVINGTLTHEARTRSTRGVQFVNNTFENTTDTPDMTYLRVSSWGGNTEPDIYLRVEDVLIEGNVTIDDKVGFQGDINDDADCIQMVGNVDRLKVINNRVVDYLSIGITIAGRTWKNNDSLAADPDDPNVDQSDYVLVKGNEVDNVGNAIYLDAPGDFVIVENNAVYESSQGLAIAGEGVTSGLSYKNNILLRNVAYNNIRNTILGGRGSAHSVEANDCSEVVENNSVVYAHNTLFADETISLNSRFQCAKNHRYKKNIVGNTSNTDDRQYDIVREFIDPSTWELDYNLFFSGSSTKRFNWVNAVYNSFQEYKNAVNQDQHSLKQILSL